MAQHIPAEKINNPKVKKLVETIRNQRYFRTSMKFFELPYDDFKETIDDEVYGCARRVPFSVVHGGQALFEVHTKPAKDLGREVTNVYLVA